jgi:cellobiose phosphorylase
LAPCIPAKWKSYRVRRQFRGASYEIEVKNPKKVSQGVVSVVIDGCFSPRFKPDIKVVLPVFNPGTTHEVMIEMGEVD